MENRYQRQQDIVSHQILQSFRPVVIGCGAIGSQVARMLAHMGSHVTLIDFDTVDDVNLSCQGFKEGDLGEHKVEAIGHELAAINSEIEIELVPQEFEHDLVPDGSIVFCCVDNIETRGEIFEALKGKVSYFIDGRMKGGDTVRIVQVRTSEKEDLEYYPLTLFKAEEAQQGACTARSTIYGAYIAAAFMVAEYVRWLRGSRSYQKDFAISLPAYEMFPIDEKAMAEAEKVIETQAVEVVVEEKEAATV